MLGHTSTVTALGWCEPLFPPPGIDAQVWNDAQDGISSAQLALGRAHQKNFGDADTNLIEAVKWFTKAALQGNSDAQQALGRAYALGIGGLQRNEAKAIEMFEAAAAKNVNYAWALAETFMKTLGCVGYDHDKAEAWYAAGATRDAQREWMLGDIYSKGLGGLAKDEAKAEECYRRSAHADHFHNYRGDRKERSSLGTKEYELGRKCELGEGVSQDAVKAAVWYKASAFGSKEYKFKSSNRSAKYQLALLYEEGRGVERDVVAAMELYQELASHHLKIRSGDWRYKRWLRKYETGRSLPRTPEIKEDEALAGYDRVKKEAMGVLAEREREAAEKKRAQIEADRKMRNERDLMRAEDLLWQAEQEKIDAERNERVLMRAEERRAKQLAIRERQQRAAEKRREQALEFESKRSQDDPEPVYPGVYWDATADGARPWRAQPQFPAGPEFFGHYSTKGRARSVCQDKVWAHQLGYKDQGKVPFSPEYVDRREVVCQDEDHIETWPKPSNGTPPILSCGTCRAVHLASLYPCPCGRVFEGPDGDPCECGRVFDSDCVETPRLLLKNDRGDLDDAEAAFRWYRWAIAADPWYAGAYPDNSSENRGLLRMNGRGDRVYTAKTAYRRAIAADPGYAKAHNNLGLLLKNGRGDLDDAEAAYRAAIAADPGYADAHTNLGKLLDGRGDLDGAEAAYRAAIAAIPGHANAHGNLGALLSTRAKQIDKSGCGTSAALTAVWEEAALHLEVQHGTDSEWTQKARAEAARHRAAGVDLDGAEAAHRTAIAADPGCANAHNNLGILLKNARKDIDGAEAAYRAAIAVDPGYADAHTNLGVLLAGGRGDFDGAEAAYHAAIAADPGYADAHTNLGVLFAQHAQRSESQSGGELGIAGALWDQAVEHFASAVSLGADAAGMLDMAKERAI